MKTIIKTLLFLAHLFATVFSGVAFVKFNEILLQKIKTNDFKSILDEAIFWFSDIAILMLFITLLFGLSIIIATHIFKQLKKAKFF